MTATIPSKRRKLDHDSHPIPSSNAIPTESDNGEQSSSEESSSYEQPATKRHSTKPQPKRIQDEDDSALYAGGVYKSSMFKLQVDEMLAEMRPNYQKRMTGVDDTLRRLKGLIEGIEDRDTLSVRARKTSLIFINNTDSLFADTGSRKIPIQIVQDYCALSRPEARQECCVQVGLCKAIHYKCRWQLYAQDDGEIGWCTFRGYGSSDARINLPGKGLPELSILLQEGILPGLHCWRAARSYKG